MKAETPVHQLRSRMKIDRNYLIAVAAIALVYLVAAKIGLSFAYSTKQVTAVWPPSGVSFVLLVVLGWRYWPGVFLGAFLANVTSHEPMLVATGIAVGNALEALVGTFVLRRLTDFRSLFQVPRDAWAFALAAVVSTPLAALIGAGCLFAGRVITAQHVAGTALLWWQGDLMGDLLFGPFLLAFLNTRAFDSVRRRWVEWGLMMAATFAMSILIFSTAHPGPLSFAYFLFPFALWAAIRLTQVGVVTCTMLVAGVALWATASGLGPFAGAGPIEEDLVQLQVFVSVLAATSLVVAMAITQRASAEEALRRQAKDLTRLELELKEANKRVTNILEDILDDNSPRRGNGDNRPG